MKKFFRYIGMAILAGSILPFTACSDDDDAVNEWNMTYVSLLPVDYLAPVPTFELTHVGNRIEGNVEFEAMVTVQKPTSQDIKVKLDISNTAVSADKLNISSSEAIIKAGQTQSEPVSISITDWSELLDVEDSGEYTLDVKIAGIETAATDVTNAEGNQSISATINKSHFKPEGLLFFDQQPSGNCYYSVYSSYYGWEWTVMDGVENINNRYLDGTGSGDLATNGVPFWLSVDLGVDTTITGCFAYYWADAYAASKVELLVSDNGTSWKSLGEVEVSGAQQYIAFKEPVTTRYFKYQMIDVPSRVSIFYIGLYM